MPDQTIEQDAAQPVRYDLDADAGAARIRLQRPQSLNAIDGPMHHALLEAFAAARADDRVRVVVLSGDDRAFSAGGDIKAVAAGEDVGDPVSLGRAIWDLPKPVVAVVQGYCIGQGFEIAAVADLLIAGESARFGELEINHGWGPPIAVTPRALGLKQAKEVLLLGELHDAAWALRTGFANRVVPDADLPAEVARVVDRLARLDPQTLAANKALVNRRHAWDEPGVPG